jgi:hypothetical protein
MFDLRNNLGLLSLVAACGPIAAQTTSETDTTATTDSTSVGPSTDSDPTDSDPTDSGPTGTATDTTPPPECEQSSDCDSTYCGYCDEGMCKEGVGCCGEYAAPARPDMQRFRCQPPPDCYEDDECGPDEICDSFMCVPMVPLQLPPCPQLGFIVTQWNLDVAPGAFLLVDLDNDGDLDLAAAQPSVAQIQIALNNGAGDFTLASSFSVGEPSDALALAAGDLDGDLDTDLAVVRNDAVGGLILAFGQDAVFTPQKALPTAPLPSTVFIRDIDGDLASDLIIVSASNVATRRGSDLATEVLAVNQPFGERPTLFDIDASGHADIVSPVPDSTAVGIYSGSAKGAFTPAIFIDTFQDQVASLGGDMTQPGVDDLPALILARSVDGLGQLDVLHGEQSPQMFGATSKYQTSAPISGATMFEVEAPQGPDLVAATGTPAVLVALGDASGGFLCERVIPVNNATSLPLLGAGDINADGIVDFIVGAAGSPELTTLRGE